MTDLLGPAAFGAARAALTRPATTPGNNPGDPDSWVQDCSSPSANDGTENRAALFNMLLALFRATIRKSGVPQDNTDDLMLAKAMRSFFMNFRTAGGTANALTIALDPQPASWAELVNVPLLVRLTALNTDIATLAVSGLAGTKTIAMRGAKYPAPAGVLQPGAVALLVYNGFSIEYLNAPQLSSASFFIHQASGSDDNSGTVGSPIKSIAEALRRTPVGGLCNIGLIADYTHNQVMATRGRRVNIQGRDAGTGTTLVTRVLYFQPNPIAANLQDPEFRATDLYPTNTSCFVLGSGDSWQSNFITYNRGIVSGGTLVNSAQFIAAGLASMDLLNGVLQSPPSGINTVWFASIVNRLSISFSAITTDGDTTGKIYTQSLGGSPLASGADPNSVWRFSSNVTSS